jgi:hypothetical protein
MRLTSFSFAYQGVYLLSYLHRNNTSRLVSSPLLHSTGSTSKVTVRLTSYPAYYFHSNECVGVNVGQAIKSEAVAYRFSHDSTDLDSTRNRISMIEQYHGRSSGVFGADEHLAGLMPSRGSELVSRLFGPRLIANDLVTLYSALS